MNDGTEHGVGVDNFRDVGAFVNLIAQRQLLPEGRLLRGGSVRALRSLEMLGGPRTVFNLQAIPDPPWVGVTGLHFPAPAQGNDVYDTRLREVRGWLKNVMRSLEAGICFPLYVHCFSGRDRTGVAVASFLRVLGVADELIVAEYCLSDGVPGEDAIRSSLEGLSDLERYFAGVNLERVRRALGAGAG